jgi:hypothetical protein
MIMHYLYEFHVSRAVVSKIGGVQRSHARNIEIGTRCQHIWEWSKTELASKEILYTKFVKSS